MSKRLTPEMFEASMTSPEERAWLAEWKRVGAPPGTMSYAIAIHNAELEQMIAERKAKASTDE